MGAPDRDIAQAKDFIAPPGYRRHRPETTLLHQLVAEHYPAFRDRRAAEDRPLPRYVEDEFEAYLKCGLLEYGFLRIKCDACQAEKLVAFSCKRRGFCPSCGALMSTNAVTGAVTLIQRFGSALNLNVHFHLLVLDGVYRREGEGRLRFVPVPAPGTDELKGLVQRIAERIGRSLERSGLITRDIDTAYLAFDPAEEAPIHGLLGSSITYRIATGPREGQKVFTLQTLPAEPDAPRPEVAESSGFSLHAGIAAKAPQRDKVERLARYVSRPPVATERLSMTRGGNVRYALKTPYRDGTTHVISEPEDFIARLSLQRLRS